jgi:hypothetical protein
LSLYLYYLNLLLSRKKTSALSTFIHGSYAAAKLEPKQPGCHVLEDGATGAKTFVFQGAHRVKFWFYIKKYFFSWYSVQPPGYTWIRQCSYVMRYFVLICDEHNMERHKCDV